MAVSKRTRYEVLRRDDHTCRYCGGRAPDVQLTVDHVVPTALGGKDDPANLVAACRDCNAGKAASNPDAELVSQVAEDAVRWAAAMRTAVDDWLTARSATVDYCSAVADRWDKDNNDLRWGRAGLPDDWTATVERWHRFGLPAELVTDAIAAAMRKKRLVANADVWRYTCGIVWKQLRELQDRANAQASGGPLGIAQPAVEIHGQRFCGHCSGCLGMDPYNWPDDERHCYTFSERDPEEGPDRCEACGLPQCVAGHARATALLEGYDAGSQAEYSQWHGSFERLQFFALARLVDGIEHYGRVC